MGKMTFRQNAEELAEIEEPKADCFTFGTCLVLQGTPVIQPARRLDASGTAH
jgi:hypothetical protein